MAEPKGRPKTLVRRHVLEIKEDTREWLEEQITRVLTISYAGKATRSAGEVIKGVLSHPVGYLSVAVFAAGVGIWIRGLVDPQKSRAIQDASTLFLKLTPEERDAARAAIAGTVEFLEGLMTLTPPPGEGFQPVV